MRSKPSIDQINYLNIGLMLAAAAAALARPFELFLLAYAILGPLHYLTEISWLHDKRYYTRGKYDPLFLLLMGGIITVASLSVAPRFNGSFGAAITFVAFGSALVFTLTPQPRTRAWSILGLSACSVLVIQSSFLQSLFGLLLPTIIHVFLFTGLFILVGALKGKTLSGMSSLLVFVTCSLAFFVISPAHSGYPISDYVRNSYRDFSILNYALMTPFSQHNLEIPANLQQYIQFVNSVIFQSPSAFAVMGFIAFAYTYHYLNWFSKTSIIQWHHIPRSRFIAVVAVWSASIVCYACDYRLGLRWLFFLSLSHVLLEFPLNHLTMINIGKELKQRATGRSRKACPATMGLDRPGAEPKRRDSVEVGSRS